MIGGGRVADRTPDLQADRRLGDEVRDEREEKAVVGEPVGHQELTEADAGQSLVAGARIHSCISQRHYATVYGILPYI